MNFPRALLVLIACAVVAAESPPVAPWSNDFKNAPVGKVPDDLMVLDGAFAVRNVDGTNCLELAADPIGAFGALFGPPGLTASQISARIWAAPTGKRFPEFGIGANDAGGYKLMLLPGQHKIELRKGDDPVASAPFDWSPSTWTCFKLCIAPTSENWLIQAKLWKQGDPEPPAWILTTHDLQPPSPGRASLWGNDYSEQPIRFNTLTVTPLK